MGEKKTRKFGSSAHLSSVILLCPNSSGPPLLLYIYTTIEICSKAIRRWSGKCWKWTRPEFCGSYYQSELSCLHHHHRHHRHQLLGVCLVCSTCTSIFWKFGVPRPDTGSQPSVQRQPAASFSPPLPTMLSPSTMSVNSAVFWYIHGFKKPSCGIPFWIRASFNSATRAANTGADAEVPPKMDVWLPPVITWYPSPRTATSGVALPSLENEPAAGSWCAASAAVKYAVTGASCHVAFVRLYMAENPPPLPNSVVATSADCGVLLWNCVAPTAVTQGDDAGHDG